MSMRNIELLGYNKDGKQSLTVMWRLHSTVDFLCLLCGGVHSTEQTYSYCPFCGAIVVETISITSGERWKQKAKEIRKKNELL